MPQSDVFSRFSTPSKSKEVDTPRKRPRLGDAMRYSRETGFGLGDGCCYHSYKRGSSGCLGSCIYATAAPVFAFGVCDRITRNPHKWLLFKEESSVNPSFCKTTSGTIGTALHSQMLAKHSPCSVRATLSYHGARLGFFSKLGELKRKTLKISTIP